jgi:hypothetical protein
MSDGTVNTPSAPPEACLGGAWPANLKFMFEQLVKRAEELDSHFDKVVTDAQSAANLALLNAVNNADLLAKQALRHAELAASNEFEEQQTGTTLGTQTAALSNDDLAKITQSVTAAVTAVLANMATGRPPVNQSGTTGTAATKP